MKIKRLPRPLGLTLIAQHLTQNKESTNDEYIGRMLTYMIANNITIKGKKLSIETLAIYTGKPVHTILKLYITYTSKLSRVMLGNRQELLGALHFLGFKKCLEDKAYSENQVEVLSRIQGGKYVPYLSTTLNQAIDINMKGTANIMALARLLTPTGPQVAIQNNMGDQPVGAIKSIGINEALKLMEDEGITHLSYNAERYKSIMPSGDNPEVRATHQLGTKNEIPILANPLEKVNTAEAKEKLTHKNRRVHEEGINEEEDTQI